MKNKDYNSINWNEVFAEDVSSPSGLRWKKDVGKRAKSGSIAGCIQSSIKSDHQCFRVQFNKTRWLVHRILWVMRNGSVDANLEIDHKDGNSLNNSVENLRLVSRSINSRNKKQRTDNKSGFNGVHFEILRSGNTFVYAQWYNFSGKRKRKGLSCNKLGLMPAFASACAYREKMIEQLNASGAGYSERHGDKL